MLLWFRCQEGQILGSRQAVRHWTLTPAFVGSNPSYPVYRTFSCGMPGGGLISSRGANFLQFFLDKPSDIWYDKFCPLGRFSKMMGSRQAVRHWTLTPAFVGSNPSYPVLHGERSGCHMTAGFFYVNLLEFRRKADQIVKKRRFFQSSRNANF